MLLIAPQTKRLLTNKQQKPCSSFMIDTMRLPAYCLLFLLLPQVHSFLRPSLCSHRRGGIRLRSSTHDLVDDQLMAIARRLKLEVYDLDEGVYGFESTDNKFGIEVQHVPIETDGGLGLVLEEMASAKDGRGLVLVREVGGNAARADPEIKMGDFITGVSVGNNFRERTTGLNYDLLMKILGQAKEEAALTGGKVTLEVERLIERAKITVEIDDGTSLQTVEALAGENLRRLMMRKGIKLYDQHTKRFDMPFATGDCAGEGLCGTCLVAVTDGGEHLSKMEASEKMVTKGRPLSWRASCRTILGPDNKPGKVRVSLHPQSRFADELDPGVRTLETHAE